MPTISESEWKWFGHPRHFCGSPNCHWHMVTEIGNFVVSSIGDYRPPMNEGQQKEIGCDRKYETYVFAIGNEVCECGCGQREFSNGPREVAAYGANEPGKARQNHMDMCYRVARGEIVFLNEEPKDADD